MSAAMIIAASRVFFIVQPVIETFSLRMRNARARLPSTTVSLMVILGINFVFWTKQPEVTPLGSESTFNEVPLNDEMVAVPSKVQSSL